jgi:hypothetical protein
VARLYIPHLRDQIQLVEDWSFRLYRESRNSTLETHLGLSCASVSDPRLEGEKYSDGWWKVRWWKKPVTLPAGTVLTIERIYIRAGQDDFSSVTFSARLLKPGAEKPTRVRFWVKLDDANTIVFEPFEAA